MVGTGAEGPAGSGRSLPPGREKSRGHAAAGVAVLTAGGTTGLASCTGGPPLGFSGGRSAFLPLR